MFPPIKIKRLDHARDLELPRYETEGAAGMDLRAAITEPVSLPAGGRVRVPTGIAMAIPAGYELQVRPRSGLAAKHGISIVNAPGTIDSDYRGEIQVLLVNFGEVPFVIQRGDRIAQGVVAAAPQHPLIEVEDLDETGRGTGGLGSTGV